VRLGDTDYSSRAVRVSVGRDEIAIEREREVRAADRRGGRGSSEQGCERERNVVTLDRLDADTLAGEGAAAGLRPLGTRTVPATRDHVASAVVILGA